MTDLAKTIAAACLEAIQARPDTPTEEELADVVRPMLPDPAEVAQVLKWGVDLAEGPSKSAVWPLNNDVESTKGKWLSGDFIPQGPKGPSGDPDPAGVSTQELYDARRQQLKRFYESSPFYDAPRVNSFKSGPCPADGCNGVVIRNSINNAGGCTCCGRGFSPTTEAPDGE